MASSSMVHIDGPLTSFATAYKNDDFISPIPDVKVPDLGGKFKKRNRRDVSKSLNDRIGDRSEANLVAYTTSDGTYVIDRRALKGDVPYSAIANANATLSPEEMATETVMQAILLAKEIRHASLLTTNTNYASSNRIAAANAWTDESLGTPDTNINSALATIPSIPQGSKLIACCGLEVFNSLRKHPRILAMKGMVSGMVSRAELAQFFELDEVRVSRLTYDTANEGQSASYARVWGTNVFATMAVPKTSGPDVQGFAVNFIHTDGLRVRKFHVAQEGYGGTDYVQVEHGDDVQAIQDDMGAIVTGV